MVLYWWELLGFGGVLEGLYSEGVEYVICLRLKGGVGGFGVEEE